MGSPRSASRRAGAGVLLLIASLAFFSPVFYLGATMVAVETPVLAEAGASSAEGNGGAPTTSQLRVVATDLSFNARTLRAAKGTTVRVLLDNQDASVLHNFSVYTTRAATTKVFAGEIFAGPGQREYTFTAPATAGNYLFRCDVHPDQMTGAFIVE